MTENLDQNTAEASRIVARLHEDGSGQVRIDGALHPVSAGSVEQARADVIGLIAGAASRAGAPVPATVQDTDGEWPILVHPDGAVQHVSPPALVVPPATSGQGLGEHPPQQSARTHAGVTQDLQRRQSFLTQEQTEEPAARGLRGALGRVGIRIAPSDEERLERADVEAVSQHWPGPRVVAVVNGKGGAGKTPTAVLLSAVFARHGGAGVLAWDNNQTRGTLGWRTDQGPHDATLLDLLPEVPRLLGADARSADLARFVHHQTRDRFDVLRSKPMVLAQHRRSRPEDVDSITAVAAKYYRLIVVDSGNDESDPTWLRMIDHSDQLVVATTTRHDHAESGALLLEALAERDERSATLAAQAAVVVTQADPTASPASVARVADGYRAIAREVTVIPFDPRMVDGILHHDSLRPATQRAWLAAAAAVARNL